MRSLGLSGEGNREVLVKEKSFNNLSLLKMPLLRELGQKSWAVPAVMIQVCASEKLCAVWSCDTRMWALEWCCTILPILVETFRKQCFHFHSESFLSSTQYTQWQILCYAQSFLPQTCGKFLTSECVPMFLSLGMNAPPSGTSALRPPARNPQPCHAFLRPWVNTSSSWDPCSNSFILSFKTI